MRGGDSKTSVLRTLCLLIVSLIYAVYLTGHRHHQMMQHPPKVPMAERVSWVEVGCIDAALVGCFPSVLSVIFMLCV